MNIKQASNEIANTSFSGSAKITDAGIKKHFRNKDAIQGIIELVWNGFDANASEIKITVSKNKLGGLELIEVFDNGDGIDVENIADNFEKFNESTKKHDDNKHGSHGVGRLAFFKLSKLATWYTKRKNYNARISIDSSTIKDYQGDYIGEADQTKILKEVETGTCVHLEHFGSNNLPDEEGICAVLEKEFGWYLALNESKSIQVNKKSIESPEHEKHEKTIRSSEIDFKVKMIIWKEKPGSEKSYNYLLDSKNRIAKKELSKFNNKIKFYCSTYIISDWADSYDPRGLAMDPEQQSKEEVLNNLKSKLLEFQTEIYKDFLRRFVDDQVEKFEENGYFPIYENVNDSYTKWRIENTKATVKEIYIADPVIFNRLNAKQSKILIRLIDRILVSNENDSLFEILNGVLDLSESKMKKLSSQLAKTTMDSIVSTIEIIQRRQEVTSKIREIMNERYMEVSETPDLQSIIESNTWVFGPQYETIGAEEDTFTKITKEIRNRIPEIDNINREELEADVNIEGANRQVDLFLARKKPSLDYRNQQVFKCTIIEIKRPSISLNKKHLRQLDDYAEIISKTPQFNSDKMRFELILVGRKISQSDTEIPRRLESMKDKGEFGLVADGKIKQYVKDWYSLLDEFELSNSYIMESLKRKLDDYSKVDTKDIVDDLKNKSD